MWQQRKPNLHRYEIRLRELFCTSQPYLISSGNCALVTRKLEMWWRCSSFRKVLISGYMMGSPTSDSAQCFTAIPSSKRSGRTPGTPAKYTPPVYTQLSEDTVGVGLLQSSGFLIMVSSVSLILLWNQWNNFRHLSGSTGCCLQTRCSLSLQRDND